uniref:Uncharacterized protein n=1 Tax=Amphiprion percula TaxID=161767 RepID=A0A3P8T8L1_AMPPE
TPLTLKPVLSVGLKPPNPLHNQDSLLSFHPGLESETLISHTKATKLAKQVFTSACST